MNLKDIVIEKLLDFGKKHKLFVYPTLALVAIISAISYVFYWSKGNGKKVVAIILALVLFISQSYFLTSSASTELIDDTELTAVGSEEDASVVSDDGEDDTPLISDPQPLTGDDNTVGVSIRYVWGTGSDESSTTTLSMIPGETVTIGEGISLPQSNDYVTYEAWYTNSDGTGDYYANGSSINVPEGGLILTLYAKRTVIAYNISFTKWCTSGDTAPYTKSFKITKQPGETTSVNIAAALARNGYDLQNISTPKGDKNLSSGFIIFDIDNSSYDYNINCAVNWSAVEYIIRYELSDADKTSGLCGNSEQYFEDTFRYERANAVGTNNGRLKKRGYNAIGWNTASGQTTALYTEGQVVNDDLYVPFTTPSTILYPVWEYVGFTLAGENASFQYGKEDDSFSYTGAYDDGDTVSGDFNYSVSSGDVAKAAEYGLTLVVDNASHKVVLSGTPTKITDTNSDGVIEDISFDIVVTDARDVTKSNTFTRTYRVDKRTLTVTGVSNNYKMYDGNVDIAVGTITFTGAASGDNLEIKCAGQSGEFDNANAGTDKNILLTGLTLYATGSTPASAVNNYTLANTANVKGDIEPRTVYIKTEATYTVENPNNIFTGEGANFAGFTITEVPSNKKSENIIDSEKTNNQTTLKNLLGITGFDVSENAWTTAGTYDINVSATGTSNYEVVVSDKGKLTVNQDPPILDTNYTISGQEGENGWYKRVTITPKQESGRNGYYSQVRLGNGDYVDSVSVLEDDYKATNGVLNIQLKNRITGAFTSVGTLEDIKVDSTAPTIAGTTITQGSENVLDGAIGTRLPGVGSFLSHGNYFRDTIDVNMTFDEDTSGNSTVYYDIFGTGVYSSVNIVNNKVSFSIIEGNHDKIAFYVSDVAGNTLGTATDPNYLVKNDVDKWVVESHGPTVDIYVKNQAGSAITSGDNKYYSRGDITTRITDNGSGIYGIKWVIDDVVSDIIEPEDSTNRQTQVEFTKNITENGTHQIQVIAYDNAENYTESEVVKFNIDNDAPEIEVTNDITDNWTDSRNVTFTVTDNLSGIKYIDVKDSDRNSVEFTREDVDKNTSNCSVVFDTKGTYYLCAQDEAGNELEYEIIFENISSEVPGQPSITVIPEEADGLNDWYVTIPSIHIVPADKVDNGTTNTYVYYKIWQGNTEPLTAASTRETIDVPLDREGVWHIKAYSQTEAGVICDEEVVFDVSVDASKPVITLSDAAKQDGVIYVNVLLSDVGSGIDTDSITVEFNGRPIAIEVNKKEDSSDYIGTFKVEYKGEYTINAKDKAGNEAVAVNFEPMTMKIKTITNISDNTANIGATIYHGTYPIKAYQVQIKTSADNDYVNVTPNVVTENGNITLSCPFTNLAPSTTYYYRIIGVSEAGENLTYEGKFKTTGGEEKGITVTGKVRYNDNVALEDRANKIYVSLYNGNTCVRSIEKNDGDTFEFDNVADGTYSIVATNGLYTYTLPLVIENGSIIYPTSSILLILGGKNTSVQIDTDDTPSISVDGLDAIFEYDKSNYTDEDIALISEGGVVEFKLVASLLKATTVADEDISAVYNIIGKSSTVGAYLDLKLYKIRTDANGVQLSREQINEIGGTSLKVTFPLGDLAGKSNLRVVRTHDGSGAVLPDIDSAYTTYTVESNKFSTYAIVYDVDPTTTDDNGDNKPTTDDGGNSSTTVDPSNPTQSNNSITSLKGSGSGSPQTGDSSPIYPIVSLFVLSLAGCIIFKKKIRP